MSEQPVSDQFIEECTLVGDSIWHRPHASSDVVEAWNTIKPWRMLLYYQMIEDSPGRFTFHKSLLELIKKFENLLTADMENDRGWTLFDGAAEEEEARNSGESKAQRGIQTIQTRTIRYLTWAASKFFGLTTVARMDNIKILEAGAPTNMTITGAMKLLLPPEIQLKIVENLDPYELDQVIRHNFPHLLKFYLKSMRNSFIRWAEALVSRKNMRYLGTVRDDKGLDVYRLRSLDLHPTLRVIDDPYVRRLQAFTLQEPPSMELSDTKFLNQLVKMLYEFQLMGFLETQHEAGVRPRENSFYHTMRQETIRNSTSFLLRPPESIVQRCRLCIRSIECFPFIIYLNTRGVGLDRRDYWRREGVFTSVQGVLLYEDELRIILRNMEPLLRPVFWSRRQQSLSPDGARNSLLRSRMAAGLSAHVCLEEPGRETERLCDMCLCLHVCAINHAFGVGA